jgi:NADH:ubiquinone oxidoreductase subunit 2 (subunit N)
LILTLATKLTPITIIIATSAAIIGGMGGIIQSQLRGILAYSSLTHLGWTISISSSSPLISINYFIIYIIILSAIISILLISNFKSHTNISNISTHNKIIISILLISLAGLPPIIGFLPKLQAIESMTTSASPIIIIFLLLGSVINLYFYLNLIFSTTTSNTLTHILKIPTYYTSSSLLTLASLPLIVLIPSIWQI